MVWIRRGILTGLLLTGNTKPRLADSRGLRLAAFQQTAAILKQPIDTRDVIELARIGLWHHLGLQLQGTESLLQANQPLRQGPNGLGKILGGPRDPEGQGVGSHGGKADLG